MTRRKTGFFTFIFSFLPGLAEMYMGLFKQGISLMAWFFGIIAVSSWINIGPLLFILPIIWFYGFFHAHALAGMRDEEFYQIEDDFIIPFGGEQVKTFFDQKKGRLTLAVILIVIGVSAIWSNVTSALSELLWTYYPDLGEGFSSIANRVPQVLIAFILVAAGISMIRGKKKQLDEEQEESE